MNIQDVKFLGVSKDLDLVGKKSSFLDGLQEYFSADQIGGGSKWKTYKALLSQSGFDAPVARVLNEDEPDYLGDINWSLGTDYLAGKIIGNLTGVFLDTLTGFLVSSPAYNMAREDDDTISIAMPDGNITDYYFEIKVRQRGDPLILLSAETDTTGMLVLLNFDKDVSEHCLAGLIGDSDLIYNPDYEDSVIGALRNPADHKQIGIMHSQAILPGEQCTINYDGLEAIESTDKGVLAPFTDFPITNNAVVESLT
jgi:hypothetical protein